jgi:hypothetical protein
LVYNGKFNLNGLFLLFKDFCLGNTLNEYIKNIMSHYNPQTYPPPHTHTPRSQITRRAQRRMVEFFSEGEIK